MVYQPSPTRSDLPLPLTLRSADQPDRQLQLPLLPATQRIRVVVYLLAQVAVLQQLLDVILLRMRVRALHRAPYTQGLVTRELGEEDVLLGHDADSPAGRTLNAALEDDGAARATEQPGQDGHGRRFPGPFRTLVHKQGHMCTTPLDAPIRPEQNVNAELGDLEAEVGHRGDEALLPFPKRRLEVLAKVLDRDRSVRRDGQRVLFRGLAVSETRPP